MNIIIEQHESNIISTSFFYSNLSNERNLKMKTNGEIFASNQYFLV